MKHKLAIRILTQHKWNAQKLTQDTAMEDDCNSQTDEVKYTNAEIMIITFQYARLNKSLVPKI